MKQARLLLTAVLLLIGALAFACGGSGGAKATPTPSPSRTAAPTATSAAFGFAAPSPTRTIPETVFDAPPPSGISTLTFIDPLHGWAIDSCPKSKSVQFAETWCTIISTDDGGVTWHRQDREISKIETPRFLDLKNGFAGMLVTNDGGNAWTRRSAQGPHDLNSITFATPKIAFAVASGIVFRLDLPSIEGLDETRRLAVDLKNSWTFNYGSANCSFTSISVSETGRVWAGGHQADGPCLYWTDDVGKSWKASFTSATSLSVAAALSETSLFHEDAASVSTFVLDNCSVEAPTFFSDVDARLDINCRMEGATLTTSDGGETWNFAGSRGACLMGCMTMNYQSGSGGPTFYVDNQHAWQRTAHQAISWTEDGGKTWNKVDSPALCCDANAIFFVDAQNGWAIVNNEIARTTDAGRTWTRLPVVIR